MLFHRHRYEYIKELSNVIQQDTMGYPLMLCIVGCRCGKTEQQWGDCSEKALEDPKLHKIVWKKVNLGKKEKVGDLE